MVALTTDFDAAQLGVFSLSACRPSRAQGPCARCLREGLDPLTASPEQLEALCATAHHRLFVRRDGRLLAADCPGVGGGLRWLVTTPTQAQLRALVIGSGRLPPRRLSLVSRLGLAAAVMLGVAAAGWAVWPQVLRLYGQGPQGCLAEPTPEEVAAERARTEASRRAVKPFGQNEAL